MSFIFQETQLQDPVIHQPGFHGSCLFEDCFEQCLTSINTVRFQRPRWLEIRNPLGSQSLNQPSNKESKPNQPTPKKTKQRTHKKKHTDQAKTNQLKQNNFCKLLPGSLTVRPWKVPFPKERIVFQAPIFQGRAVKLRGDSLGKTWMFLPYKALDVPLVKKSFSKGTALKAGFFFKWKEGKGGKQEGF